MKLAKSTQTLIANCTKVLAVIALLMVIALFGPVDIQPVGATITQSAPVQNIISPVRTEGHRVTWSTTDATGILTCSHKFWGRPMGMMFQWTTATPYADAEVAYIIPSEYEGASLSSGQITIYRDEGITGGCISGAICDIVLFWPNR